MIVDDYSELFVHKAARKVAMDIFWYSKKWPKEERYSLTDQIRRSSRSVCGNIAEAWCKRRYERHFISKLSDAEAEAAQTMNWLQFAHHCGYRDKEDVAPLLAQYRRIRAALLR